MNPKKYTLLTLVAGLACWGIAALVALQMLDNIASETLFGNKPLYFWAAFWAGVLLLLGRFVSKLPQNNKLVGASILSGLLLTGGFMPMPTFFLMFIGFVPLLWAENQVALSSPKTSTWLVFKLAFISFFTWNIGSTWWIQNSSLIAGSFSNILNAIFMTVPFMAYHITKKTMGIRGGNWGFIGYWLSFEIGHLSWDLAWPWLTLGNSFAHLPILIQWYEYTGVFGGSLWILSVNLYLANQIHKAAAQNSLSLASLRPAMGYVALAILLPIGLSMGIYYTYDSSSSKSIEVVSVQPNYEPHYQKFRIPQNTQIEHFKQLSNLALSQNTDYLIFPETSFGNIDIDKIQSNIIIQTFRDFIKEYPKLNLVMGLNSYKEYQKEEEKPEHIYTYCSSDKSYCRYIDSHNSAIQLNNESKEIPYYKKSKLVPGAESMPFIGGIGIFRSLILDLGGTSGISLGTQKEREVFESKNGKIAPLICYESIFGDYVTGYVRKGAEVLFVITNDGWWDNSWGHQQHVYLSSLRAIENRRAVVRAANSGISCYINSRGDVRKPSKYAESAVLKDTVYLHNETTIYSQYGDLIGRVSILLSIWLVVTMISNVLRREKKK